VCVCVCVWAVCRAVCRALSRVFSVFLVCSLVFVCSLVGCHRVVESTVAVQGVRADFKQLINTIWNMLLIAYQHENPLPLLETTKELGLSLKRCLQTASTSDAESLVSEAAMAVIDGLQVCHRRVRLTLPASAFTHSCLSFQCHVPQPAFFERHYAY
jgi:hypothetical protein